jgi:formylglycine-generating enzyme
VSRPGVFVTGLGVVSAAGLSCADTLEDFRMGRRRPGAATAIDSSVAKPVFEVSGFRGDGDGGEMRTIVLAFQAADEALAAAGFGDGARFPRVGVSLGTTVASQLNDLEFYRAFRSCGRAPIDAADRYLRGNLAAAVALRYGFSGPAATVVNACSSGTDAIGIALAWLREGLCDAAIAGGADELSRIPMDGFNALGIMSDAPCAPFDRDRRGLTLGEGAGILFLETAESAKRRGVAASVACEGYGTCADAYHLTAPREDGSGLEAARRASEAEKGRAESAQGRAKAAGAEQLSGDTWARAVAQMGAVQQMHAQGRYAEAEQAWKGLAGLFERLGKTAAEAAAAEAARQAEIQRKAEAERQAEERRRAEREAAARRKAEEEAAKARPRHKDVEVIDLGGGVKLEMVYIEPGTYNRGSPAGEKGRDSDETQHRVTLTKGYWMGKHEVTQEQWERVMGTNPSRFKGAKNPVEQVSWEDCQRFIQELNRRISGGGFRLPTEAEWEYACRAGATGPFAFGDCLGTSEANYDGNYPMDGCRKGQYRQRTLPVGSLRANAWGLYDMHGNVWEWCQDWYGSYPSGAVTDPPGPGSGESRVYRGGCWFYIARYCRSAFRYGGPPGNRNNNLGLRLARTTVP